MYRNYESKLKNKLKFEGDKMIKVGMLIAVEIDALLGKYGENHEIIDCHGFKIYKYTIKNSEIFAIHSGAGQVYAAAATQLLICKFDVNFILNFGVVGGLTEEMTLEKTCVVKSVVHYDFDTSAADKCEVGRYLEYPDIFLPTDKNLLDLALKIKPELKQVICASGDKFIASKIEKEKLHREFKADICEMEAAAIVLICNKCKVPCLLIKTVSDSIKGGADEFFKSVDTSAQICMEICSKVIEELLN
jgi:adenosylhomocysteine nucleosidase